MTLHIDRPHYELLRKGVEIFRDRMRRFVMARLEAVKGRSVVEILLATAEERGRLFSCVKRGIQYGEHPEDLIDVSHFPHLVQSLRHDVFKS